MDNEYYFKKWREEATNNDITTKKLADKEHANNMLFARCVDLQEDLKVAQELAHAVLTKSVDRYLQTQSVVENV